MKRELRETHGAAGPGRRLNQSLLAIVTLFAFAVPTAVPHLHALSDHAAEICAGHLSHEGAEDACHAGACPTCRTARRGEIEAAFPHEAYFAIPDAKGQLVHHADPCHKPSRPRGDCEKTRAPPFPSLDA